jgi:hypothetical protein
MFGICYMDCWTHKLALRYSAHLAFSGDECYVRNTCVRVRARTHTHTHTPTHPVLVPPHTCMYTSTHMPPCTLCQCAPTHTQTHLYAPQTHTPPCAPCQHTPAHMHTHPHAPPCALYQHVPTHTHSLKECKVHFMQYPVLKLIAFLETTTYITVQYCLNVYDNAFHIMEGMLAAIQFRTSYLSIC